MTPKQQLRTVWVFFIINMKRLFRDRLALFFTFLFPLIFLFVFGAFSKNSSTNFHVAVINRSDSAFSKRFVEQLKHDKLFKVDKEATTLDAAKEKMGKSQLDGTILLPPNFGEIKQGQSHPSGQVQLLYNASDDAAGQTLTSLLDANLNRVNAQFVDTSVPFSVEGKRLNEKALTAFDYAFTGILGFAILGAGIFGPMNVFPELKKMGILRRLRTTPLRVWQYFLATMLGNAVSGLLSLGVMFLAAVWFFNLKVVGNYLEITAFLAFGIVVILGIGLALGGWAKNERQVAPLGNIIVFPMMFLSGVFFPRYLMPDWLQNVSNYLPLTPVIDGARLLTTEGKHLIDLGPQLGIMAVWMVIVYAIAFRVFRWE